MPTVNISTESDADFRRGFVYQMTNGTPIDLTGDTMRMGIRRHATDATEQLLLTTENGGIEIVDAANGKFNVTIEYDALRRLAPGDYVHSLIRIHAGERLRIWSGTLTHAAGASR